MQVSKKGITMNDVQFAALLRALLALYATMTATQINDTINSPQGLKESLIAQQLAGAVGLLNQNKLAFAAALDAALVNAGAVWNVNVYNLNGLAMSFGIKLVAREELSAIRTHAPTIGFDAAKALTNMLRLIKAAER